MRDCIDFINAKEFNRLTEVLERNTSFLGQSFLDDDYFNQIETILMGVGFETSNGYEEFLNEEMEYLDLLEVLELEEENLS